MKLELKNLAGYLPYGLKIKTTHGWDTMLTLNDWSVNGDCEQSYCYETEDTTDIKPILRPLSDLAKEIEVNGEKFVPYENLSAHFEVEYYGNMLHKNVEKLLEWHFDIFGLIESGLAIDINTLDKEL